jgi:hypothetical protein
MILLGLLTRARIDATTDPFGQLAPAEETLLKPQIERWIHDQLKHVGLTRGKYRTRPQN